VQRALEMLQDLFPRPEAGAVRLVDDHDVKEIARELLEQVLPLGIFAPQGLIDAKIEIVLQTQLVRAVQHEARVAVAARKGAEGVVGLIA